MEFVISPPDNQYPRLATYEVVSITHRYIYWGELDILCDKRGIEWFKQPREVGPSLGVCVL